MKTAMEHVPTRRVMEGRTSSPEPRFRQSWSRLRKLRWHASLIMAEHPGVRLYVEKGRSWTNSVFNYGLFSIAYNQGGMSPMSFDRAWDVLNGIEIGLRIAESAQARTDADR